MSALKHNIIRTAAPLNQPLTAPSLDRQGERLNEEARSLNVQLGQLPTAVDRLLFVLTRYAPFTLVLTNGGIHSRVLPALLEHSAAVANNSVTEREIYALRHVLIDTGDLFDESLSYALETGEQFGINLIRISHDFTPGEFRIALGARISAGEEPLDAFDQLTKVRVLQAATAHPELFGRHSIKMLIAGNRRDQAASRLDLPFIEAKNGLLYFYPLADWSEKEANEFEILQGISSHPLAAFGYRSLGNKFDTSLPIAGSPYEKDGRHAGRKTECGIHLRWGKEAHDGLGIRIIKDWTERVHSPRDKN